VKSNVATPSEDGRHIVVNGRKWRAADPAIPESLRAELVAELMAARREIHLQRDDTDLVQAARARVSDAKHALGERGHPWWEKPTPAELDNRTRAAIRALTSKRGPGTSICPSDVARVVASPDWQPVMPSVRSVARQLAVAGDVVITKAGTPVDPFVDVVGPIRIAAGPR